MYWWFIDDYVLESGGCEPASLLIISQNFPYCHHVSLPCWDETSLFFIFYHKCIVLLLKPHTHVGQNYETLRKTYFILGDLCSWAPSLFFVILSYWFPTRLVLQVVKSNINGDSWGVFACSFTQCSPQSLTSSSLFFTPSHLEGAVERRLKILVSSVVIVQHSCCRKASS